MSACSRPLPKIAYRLQLSLQLHDPNAPESIQPMRAMYPMEVKGLEVIKQVPVEQPARA